MYYLFLQFRHVLEMACCVMLSGLSLHASVYTLRAGRCVSDFLAALYFFCSLNVLFFQTDSSWRWENREAVCFVGYERRFHMKSALRLLFLSAFATPLFVVVLLCGLLPQSVFAASRCSHGSHFTTVVNQKASPVRFDAWRQLPDLTGTWINQAMPSNPAWTVSQNGNTVTASYCCPAGHPNLYGSFTGTMSNDGTKVTGMVHVVEGSITGDTEMTWTIINKDTFIFRSWNRFRGDWDTATMVRA